MLLSSFNSKFKQMASESAVHYTGTADNQLGDQKEAPVMQYILVRTDLNWETGALIAQACHASVASIASTLDARPTKDYLRDLDNMHKVILRADKPEELIEIGAKLKEANVAHHLWIEKPENIATCLAVSPQPKPLVQAIFKRFKLFK